jgi:hypothetical protein
VARTNVSASPSYSEPRDPNATCSTIFSSDQCESNQSGPRRVRSQQPAPIHEKKRNQPTTKQEWQEGAGGLLLLAAARETNLLSQLEATLSAKQDGSGISRPSSPRLFDPQQVLLLTLLFLPAVGLHRPWDLRSYTGQELALLTGRSRSYSYRHTERFLLKLSKLGGDQALTEALARWTASLWPAKDAARDTSSPYFYLDGHRKPVYTQTLIPRGLIGRSGKILGCRALTLLHDEQGHPLLATTHRGDLHLTAGIASLLTHYEQMTNTSLLTNLVVDREAMAAEFLAQLKAQGRTLTTILKTNQYAGLDSFSSVGAFVPLTVDRQGKVLREVAPAQFLLAHPNQNEEPLRLAVALIRDLRKVVPCSPSEENLPCAWWADIRHEEVAWWQEGWQATPAPAPPTEPKLIPIVTTAEQIDALALARAYIHRWPAQENVIKDFLLPLGLDINHGFAKVPVVNSEVSKKREALEKQLANARRWGEAARAKAHRASVLSTKLWKQTKEHSEQLYRTLNERIWEMEAQGMSSSQLRAESKKLKAEADAELEPLWQRVSRVREKSHQESTKHERYCRKQRELLRALDDLTANERLMYEVDNRKDQIMTICKLALANLVMWVRDHFFPSSYAHATWLRLQPFFRLPGCIQWGHEAVHVQLRPFNDRQLTRDLLVLCQRVNEIQPRLPDGRLLILHASSSPSG